MIKVQEVDGVRRLVCVEDHTISFNNFPICVGITAGKIGAIVHMPIDTEVDWWAEYGCFVAEGAIIENSYIGCEKGKIESASVIIQSYILTKDVNVASLFPYSMTSIRNSYIIAEEFAHFLYSEVQRLDVINCGNIIVMESAIEDTQMRGTVNVFASKVSNLDVFSGANVEGCTSMSSWFSAAQDMPPCVPIPKIAISLIKAYVEDVKVSPRTGALLMQCSTVTFSEFDCDTMIANSIMHGVQLRGDMIHSVNSNMQNSKISCSQGQCSFIDQLFKDEEQSIEHTIMIGNESKQLASIAV